MILQKPIWKPLLQGGTGVLGDLYVNPSVFPEAYEAGTLNMPAIWSLKVALDWINENKERLKPVAKKKRQMPKTSEKETA